MLKRKLGRTNLNVSVIGFGGAQIQKLNDETSFELLNKAVESGIICLTT